MSLFKFKIIFFVTFACITLEKGHAFGVGECLDSNYKTEVSHKGTPFGLAKNILGIEKNGCEITVTHEKLKFMKSNWLIDVCREPVHIKKTTGSVTVIKRSNVCTKDSKEDFCSEYKSIRGILQDDGLIFAKGEKEDLSSDHGKVFCTYVLLDAYLDQGKVLSRHGDIAGQFQRNSLPADTQTTNEAQKVEQVPAKNSGSGTGTGSF